MMLKTMQFNDHLPLTLGAKVDLTQPAVARNPEPVDIDLSVKWVGDILDDAVSVSDMRHKAAPVDSDRLRTALFDRGVFQSGLQVGVDPAHGDDMTAMMKTWVDSSGNRHVEPVKYEDTYLGLQQDAARIGQQIAQRASVAKGQTATGLQMLNRATRKWLTGDFESPPTVYTIEGVDGYYTKREYEDFERRKAGGLAHWPAAMMAKKEREDRLALYQQGAPRQAPRVCGPVWDENGKLVSGHVFS